jgi:hypothetical protein
LPALLATLLAPNQLQPARSCWVSTWATVTSCGLGGATGYASFSIVSLYCTHLACLFPQHAPGRKHNRDIRLETWQSEILERQPWPFLRGCIRSDGCIFVNRTGPYSYVSYDFSNHSADILALFTLACDLVGVEYRAYARHVRIYRRDSVALMQQHVGGKA